MAITPTGPDPTTTRPPADGSMQGMHRLVTVAVVAQAVEYFDFFVYATAAAIVLGPLFFAELGPTAATFASFATFAVGFVARPLGGAVAGHYGDKLGRKPVLVASTVTMGVATFAMGLLPTSASIGVAAPVLLVLLRLLQGFALGGQWGGASLLLTESAPKRRRGYYGSYVQVGAQLGLMGGLGSFLVVLFFVTPEQLLAWGWRLPFLSGIVMIGIGLYIHRALEDTPVFRRLQAERGRTERPTAAPLRTAVRENWRAILLAGGAFVLPNAVGFIVTSGVLDYGTRVLGLDRSALLSTILVACLVPLVALPYAAHLSDRVGRRRMYILGVVAVCVWAWPMFLLIDSRNLVLIFVALAVGLGFHSMMFGPQVALYSELFSAEVRYSGASLGYQVGSVFGGGLAPLITAAVLDATGAGWSVAAYMTALGLVSFASVWFLRDRSDVDM